ncbi:hypothetical protein AB3M83_02765 [Microbacterium sp. 179-B 1A2 NHS]|uniref:hypothetical protein n=1 Tax=Microbacterium sp. 179-B 1A2 NHS TaxID=3142383 RepID=UPI00399EF079
MEPRNLEPDEDIPVADRLEQATPIAGSEEDLDGEVGGAGGDVNADPADRWDQERVVATGDDEEYDDRSAPSDD